MTLKLTLIGMEDRLARDRQSRVFDTAGGSIGRAADNDWVLPDPERFLSSHHARLRYHRGDFFIEDTSTNGVYMNGAADPLGKTGPQQLRDGDTLRMGAYQIQVEMLPVEDLPLPSLSPDIGASAIVSHAIAPTADPDDSLDANFALESLLGGTMAPIPRNELVAPLGDDHGELLTTVPASDAPMPMSMRQAEPAPEPRREVRAEAPVGDAAIVALCRGAGLNPRAIPADSQSRLLQVAGMLLREALLGVKQLDAAQRKLRQEHGLAPAANDSTLAEMASLQIEDLLQKLMTGHQKQKLDAVQWLRELYASARGQDIALLGALRRALGEYLPQLDKALPPKLGDGLKRFRSLTEMPDGELPHLLKESLARAFNEELHRLKRSG